ncbi:mitochondrial carrier domain-containing protein [Aspergillus foveolatus]|uniref:mitochondrial carrier domain-containing protein n=1 Tax=Aspergillus foveolatus TaxID=210207 RepID=UPI003CCD4BEA
MAETKAADTAKEFMVGAAGGITQVIIGQPFDIVKVRMQVQANRSAIQVGRDIWRNEGALALYKGTLPPLLGVGACPNQISIVYSTFHAISSSLCLRSLSDDCPGNQALTSAQTFLAGGLAGLANSFVSGPVEHIRIRLQTQTQTQTRTNLSPSSSPISPKGPGQLYYGMYSCIRQITSTSGLTGLYRGQVPTMLREFGSYGVWFSVYEYLVSNLSTSSCSFGHNQRTQESASEMPKWKVASCGALTGIILWGVNYPFDVIKSKMQADGVGSKQRYWGVIDVVSQTWRQDGLRGFWRGVGMAIGRAVPVCGGTFVVVEMVRGWM